MTRPDVMLLVATALIGVAARAEAQGARAGQQVPVIGGACEGCEAVFQGMPAEFSSVTRIGPGDQPGERMRIEGVVRDRNGRPIEGVIVYAYHTNAEGVYPPEDRLPNTAAYRHGRLRGWARTDARGRYAFDTIRPGSYPSRNAPAHVHMHVIEPGCCTYFIDEIQFTDDPLLPASARGDRPNAIGGSGLVEPERGQDGIWRVRRDITLGLNVRGYERVAGLAGSMR
jgi:protocatechuate 3,4-dioxygenase beta subunit